MPIVLPPISRRRFLAGSLALGSGLLLPRHLWAAESPKTDPDRFALLSDTHINAEAATVNKDVNMADHLKRVVAEVVALDPRPAAVLIDGDLAHLTGEIADYTTFLDLVKPMREAGLTIHLTLGNHDRRERFWKAVPPEGQDKPVEHRHISIVKSARANWFILDSLNEPSGGNGLLGEAQLKWLTGALDTQADKPALVMVHHNPPSGLIDTKALLDVILPRKHVKSYLFGHTHDWHATEQEKLHEVNLPPTSYVFTAGKPSGWVDVHLADAGARMELRCVDVKHPKHGETLKLAWR